MTDAAEQNNDDFSLFLLHSSSCPQGEPGASQTDLMKGQKGEPGLSGQIGLKGTQGTRGNPGPVGYNGFYC